MKYKQKKEHKQKKSSAPKKRAGRSKTSVSLPLSYGPIVCSHDGETGQRKRCHLSLTSKKKEPQEGAEHWLNAATKSL